jgi:hypothetical protein
LLRDDQPISSAFRDLSCTLNLATHPLNLSNISSFLPAARRSRASQFHFAVEDFHQNRPAINIPVVSVIWTYNDISPDDMPHRIVIICERAMTTTVNDIKYIGGQAEAI